MCSLRTLVRVGVMFHLDQAIVADPLGAEHYGPSVLACLVIDTFASQHMGGPGCLLMLWFLLSVQSVTHGDDS